MRKGLLLLLSVMMSMFLPMNVVFAEDSVPTVGFQAEAQLPEIQVNKDVSYFDVGVKPNEKFTLHVKVENPTDKEVTVIPSIHRAKTNGGGVVEYLTKSEKIGANAQANIEEIATINEKEINLKPKEIYDLKIEVNMPNKELEGIQAGAIQLLQKDSEEQTGNVHNQFAREIGLILESSSPEKIDSKLTLNQVTAGQVNARNAVLMSIENSQPKFTVLTDLKGVIQEKDSGKKVAETSINEGKLAPNEFFDFPVSLDGKEFEEGTYMAIFTAKEGEKTWKLEKEFTVTNQESEKLNQSDVTIRPSFIEQYGVIIVILVLLLLLLVLLLILNKKNKKHE